MGFSRDQYALLVRRMLGIGMTKLRRKVKVINGVFGVWKERPRVRGRKSRDPGKGPSGGGTYVPRSSDEPTSPGSPPPGVYEMPGKIRLIVDMRKGNCYFLTPDGIELVREGSQRYR